MMLKLLHGAEYDYRHENISDMAFITVSTGVGGGLIQQGQLQLGKRVLQAI